MKKIYYIFAIAFIACAAMSSCNKEVNAPIEDDIVVDNPTTAEQITISATLSEALTKVDFTAAYSGGKPTQMDLTWADGDKLRIFNEADHSQYDDFELAAECIGKTKGSFSGTPVNIAGAASYDVEILNGAFDYNTQTQPSDGVTTRLKYMASASGITDYSSIEFTNFSSVLAITAKMPDGVADDIKSVDITAYQSDGITPANIFDGEKSLRITFDTTGDDGDDDILTFYGTLPVGNTEIDAGTILLVHFNAPETSHTVYTRYIELPGNDFTANKLNTININATQSDKHAGKTSDDGTTSAKAYLIGDKYQMLKVIDLMKDDETVFFKLVDNIDMDGETWASLNNVSSYLKLVDFDGNGKTISNLGGSLFYVFKGSIRNLTLDHSTVTGSQRGALAQYIQGIGHEITNVDIRDGSLGSGATNAGGLIGRINSGSSGITTATITDCDVTNTAVNGACAGGLLGSVEAKVIVSNCSYSGNTVTGTSQKIGGFVGVTSDNIGCTFTRCRVENATVDASGITGDARGGGFIGQLGEGSEVKGCVVGTPSKEVLVKAGSYNTEKSKSVNTGGFVGVNYGVITKDDASNRSKAYVQVTSTNTTGNPLNLGGFAGFQRGTISYSDAVVSMGDLQGQYIGGFCGYVVFQSGKTVVTDNCTVVGDGDAETVDIRGNNYTGGFVGVAESGDFTISNCRVREGTVVVGQSTAGGFAGQIKSGTVEDCSANVDMRCRGGNDGGFVGAITGGTVQRCSSTGTLSRIENSNNVFGGFVGYLNGVDLSECSSTINISVAAQHVGGLIGDFQTANTVSKCYYNGTISGPANSKGGLVGTIQAVAAVITNCYTAGEIVASSGTQIYGGIVGELKAGASVTNCYSTMDITHGGRATGGIVGRACSAGWPVSNESNNTVSKCIAWNPNITFDGTASTSASSGAIIGYTSFKNILNNCYRRYDMVYKNSNTATGTSCQTSMVDQVDSDGTNWTVSGNRPSGAVPAGTSADAQYQAPYYGVAASNLSTVSSLAETLGWDGDIWNFEQALPRLKWTL